MKVNPQLIADFVLDKDDKNQIFTFTKYNRPLGILDYIPISTNLKEILKPIDVTIRDGICIDVPVLIFLIFSIPFSVL